MQTLNLPPLELIIPGAYYDSQIYDGRLYLWTTDDSIITLDWDNLIHNISIDEKLKISLILGFQYGEKLYKDLLFQDSEIQELLIEKFKNLSEQPIEVSNSVLDNYTIIEQENPLPFPHSDSYIHYGTVFVGSQSGVSASRCKYDRQTSLNPKSIKLWDAPVLSLSASHLTLALATGSEGLFDYSLVQRSGEKRNEPRSISSEHSNFARWLYPGIFSSSYFNRGYFADFKESKESQYSNEAIQLTLPLFEDTSITKISSLEKDDVKIKKREFQKTYQSNDIFDTRTNEQSSIFTWGSRDKICLVTENSIELVRCFPRKKEAQKFQSIGSVSGQYFPEDIVSADSSFFGIVLEEEDSLLVINSLRQQQRFLGEPVNWRVFPQSRNYTNQLHIIYEDSIHIYSFNHDYFVDQKKKKIGMSFKTK